MSETSDANSISIEVSGNAVIARPQISIMDDAALKKLERAIDDACKDHADLHLVILDLSSVTTIPSLGLGLLVQVQNKCRARQQRVKLAGVQPHMRKVFNITRLDRIFQFSDNVRAALE
jgi:anti-anti-sigma factor